jgi:hypothetical protein
VLDVLEVAADVGLDDELEAPAKQRIGQRGDRIVRPASGPIAEAAGREDWGHCSLQQLVLQRG